MSHNRYNRKPDTSQSDIVKELRDKGYRVDIISRPVDLLVTKIVSEEQLLRVLKRPGGYLLVIPLEAKTARGRKNPRPVIDKRQKEQIEFIDATGTRRVCTPFEALLAVGEKVAL